MKDTVDLQAAAQKELRAAVHDRQLVVCVGSGGVGKTTTAAALGIQAALDGRRVIVVTIDPAKRLANSLGLEALGNDQRQIDPERFREFGLEPKGTLHAMMLDTQATFDEVISRVSPDDATRDRVLGNRIYKHISDTLSASHDYMASEKLHDLYNSKKYDLIVLDTPPMKNAIDFLEAGGQLARFLDDSIISWFLKPHEGGRRIGSSLITGTGTIVYRLLSRVFGNDFMDEIAEFFLATKDLLAGFRERAEAVGKLLRDRTLTRFVVVCTPRSVSMDEARYFHMQLLERQMPGGLFIVNQTGRYADFTPSSDGDGVQYLGRGDRDWIAQALAGKATTKNQRMFVDMLDTHLERSVALDKDDLRAVEGLRAFAGRGAQVCVVPRLPEDIYDLDGLLAIDGHLFGQGEEAAG